MNDDFRKDFESEEEIMAEFDKFLEEIRPLIEAQESRPVMPNEKEMKKFFLSLNTLAYLIRGKDIKLSYEVGEVFKSSGSITLEGSEFIFSNPGLFAKAASFADNMEVYPLTNGNVRMAFAFHSLNKPVV